MSRFGRVQRKLNDKGEESFKGIYITKEITLVPGDFVFFNDPTDTYSHLVKNEIITQDQMNAELSKIKEGDVKNSRETLYLAKLGKRKEQV
jgi:hypothetical protein